jgi:Protein of unknown function DUF58
VAALCRPLWSRVGQVLAWVSPLGWTVLVLGLLSWVFGVRMGWVELLMVAGSALVLFSCCTVLALGRTRVAIEADVEPRRVTVGQPATGRVLVINQARRVMLPVLVELPVGLSAARFVLPPLGAGARHEELFVVPTHRRGVITVGPATTVQGDPLGLLRRSLTWTEVTNLFVHPRTTPLENIGAGLLRDLEGAVTEDLSMSDLAFHALREYQPGDDRRYIHWRSSAKVGRLLVRQFLDTRRSHLNIMIDADPASFRRGEQDAETAISVGASLAVRSIMDEQDTTVVCGAQRASRTTIQLTMDSLSRVELGTFDLFQLAVSAASLAPDTSIAFMVTGPHRPFIELQRAAGQFDPEVKAVVVVVDPDQRHGIRRGGGLVILTLSHLEDLRSLLVSGVTR